MKRILCLALALVMLVGMFTVGASAAGTADITVTVTDTNNEVITNAIVTIIEREWKSGDFVDEAIGTASFNNGVYTAKATVEGQRIKVHVSAEGYESAMALCNGSQEVDVNGNITKAFTCKLTATEPPVPTHTCVDADDDLVCDNPCNDCDVAFTCTHDAASCTTCNHPEACACKIVNSGSNDGNQEPETPSAATLSGTITVKVQGADSASGKVVVWHRTWNEGNLTPAVKAGEAPIVGGSATVAVSGINVNDRLYADAVIEGYEYVSGQARTIEASSGVTVVSDDDGNAYVDAKENNFSATFVCKVNASETKPTEPAKPAAPAKWTMFNIVDVVCAKHTDKTYSWLVESDAEPQLEEDGKYYCYYTLSTEAIEAYVKSYNKDVAPGHAANTRNIVGMALVWNGTKWEIAESAKIQVTCSACCYYGHKHAITYTDGVAGTVLFKDITYYQYTGEYTKTPATPVRAGYKFVGWSPAVSTKVTGCATYVAQWAPATTPALTTKHVAYLKGYGGGLVKPEGNITRAEAITMLYRLMDDATIKQFYTTYNAFSDVAKDAWYNDAVSTMVNAGILRYKTGELKPNEAITRAEFFYMLTKFSNVSYVGKCTFIDVPTTYWAYKELTLAQYLGWIKGYGGGVLNPDDTITRAEVAASLNRVLGRTTCKVKDTKNFSDNPTTAWYYQDIVEASVAH